ncbi:MAG: hypothetical protein LC643_00665, partial [Bacteroidales bacterium]|nr:hypothetical protein [Bacteroidales bacterium]
SPSIKGFELNGEKVDGVLSLDDNYQLRLEKEEQEAWHCPKCKEGLMIKGRSAYGCERYAQGCKVVVPFEFMGKKLTDKQMGDLILKGKTSVLKGFVDAQGHEKSGKLTWDGDYRVVLE